MEKGKTKDSVSDKVFYVVNGLFLFFCLVVVALPLINVISQSFSSPQAVIAGRVYLWPVDFNVNAYKRIFTTKLLMIGYRNSFLYTFVGTLINIVMTVAIAYPLSRKDFVGRNIITGLFVFTMIFSAPLIPTYLTIKNLGLLDTFWVMVLPGAISVYNMIIARTFFQSTIPAELFEAAELDGASDIRVLTSVILPLSKPILAVLVLYYAVGHWNSYFDGMIYLNTETKFPLQVVLRNILASVETIEQMVSSIDIADAQKLAYIEVMKYAIIVFGSIPVIILYPFVQKYFVKGVMIGSVKG
ncbi:protein LplC [Thermoclostridium stercorarium subsp. stercorarium DSM 8532]|jgi:putative aldouronate transport system permease protein|uniref:Protein LplC n=2 Tax=Thermoclostridium stercorarium TaxID=1510 RepID=L7VMT2_THES1|nr:carbohydrate ABC transporter permease [Thermoclostridium stercorarium]AGC68052.1 protein LplC [Thermoclostridium stercorarium subsp. stercorarium DSM 8532]AGI39081.1 ABC transporter periplasmic subunit-2 [Thermoclostridium stercorarium subsp. stercorarium DSM 8532]ANW98442.1 sugar ABC transporter permease [Thermoclostridium stercorarium subsp. thermolacticum DSM 2910]